jgi:hypothetical protein
MPTPSWSQVTSKPTNLLDGVNTSDLNAPGGAWWCGMFSGTLGVSGGIRLTLSGNTVGLYVYYTNCCD